jgi:hypothetical protein
MMVVFEPADHEAKMAAQQQQYDERLAAWNALTAQQQTGKKAPRNQLPKMKVACLCAAQHNHGNIDGGNCRECRMHSAGLLRIDCAICQCQCRALFPIEEVAMIKRAIVAGIDGKSTEPPAVDPTTSTLHILLLSSSNTFFTFQTIWATCSR